MNRSSEPGPKPAESPSLLERLSPKTWIRLVFLAAIVYLVWPYDALPDLAGWIGRLDDLAILGWLGWLYWTQLRPLARAEQQRAGSSGPFTEDARRRTGGPARPQQAPSFDPYAVLGVGRDATMDEIRAAYRARMQEYHPDKVSHLGEALQQVAHEKSQEIQRAYRALKR